MKYSKYLILLLLLGFFHPLRAQQNDAINWKTWPELEQALHKEPKPVFVFFHAEWCAYCKKIQREIFTKKEVIEKINKEYYAVEMDVERTDTIQFDGLNFSNTQALKKRNGVHELPLLLASREKRSFVLPATLIFDRNFRIKERVFEYYTSKKLMNML